MFSPQFHHTYKYGCVMKYCLLLLALFSPTAFAQTSKSLSLTNTSTVVGSCSISTSENLNFGLFDPLNPQALTNSGSVSVDCTYGTYGISISNGLGGSGYASGIVSLPSTGGGGYTYYVRCMRSMKNSAGDDLYYELYSSSNYTTPSNNSTSSSTYTSSPPSAASKRSCAGTNISGFRTVSFTSKGVQNIPIYGKINIAKWASNSIRPGAYSDQVSVSITF